MLQSIRDRAQGWFAWAIVILITIPFALWGIQEYTGIGGEPVVARINGTEITDRQLNREVQRYRQAWRERLGDAYQPELFEGETLRKQVLENIIRRELIMQNAADLGLAAGNDMLRQTIAGMPGFQIGGQFDKTAYETALRYRGLTPPQYEDQLRWQIVTEQLQSAIERSASVTEKELADAIRLSMQQRELAYLRIPVAQYASDEAIPESKVTEYYESHQAAFIQPERVRVEFVELDLETLGRTLSADEGVLRGYYEQNIKAYGRAEEKRVSHILIEVAEGSDSATVDSARERARSIRDRVQGGEGFAAVAAELSEDPVSAEQGGDLGFVQPGLIGEAFDAAIAAMDVNEVSDPLRSRFGFHIAKVAEIRPSTIKPFEEVGDEVLQSWRKSEAERVFYDRAERLSNRAYEEPDSLVPAAGEAGLEVRTSGWIDRRGGEGILAAPKVVRAAFSEDVLVQGLNSEAIELGAEAEHLLVLRVKDHEEQTLKPLAEVREQILGILRTEAAEQEAASTGESWLERLRGGETLESLAESENMEVIDPGMVDRNAGSVPTAVVESLFRLPKPSGDQPVYGHAVLPDGDYMLLRMTGLRDGDPTSHPEQIRWEIRRQLAEARGKADFEHLVQRLRAIADISITPSR